MSHWKHNLTTLRVKSRWKGTCSCGWQSKVCEQIGEVTEAYAKHTKLVEKEPKPRADQ